MPELTELTFDERSDEELWRHRLTVADVLDVLERGEFRTFRDKVRGRRLMIGPDHGGRLLTVVVEPVSKKGTCRVITGWLSSSAERTLFSRSGGTRDAGRASD